ncbi:hypothetical protein G6L68_23150 [Agrobacterium fabrum]|uniref:hypothetical protein n=1 Tax=Agrobacterium fabrum TaxID=1176649 RepID=UPI000F0CF350|nr:hypothetical protein [Agrobacterium fabrum]AYM65998.1 hypothetical protein At12D13_48460 [Agrobacterium fabrum]NTE63550.1 hypothetical protein [Agrobacterium fabrum]
MTRDIDSRIMGTPNDPKKTHSSTWKPRPKESDVITNNAEGAPPVPVGQPGDREDKS